MSHYREWSLWQAIQEADFGSVELLDLLEEALDCWPLEAVDECLGQRLARLEQELEEQDWLAGRLTDYGNTVRGPKRRGA